MLEGRMGGQIKDQGQAEYDRRLKRGQGKGKPGPPQVCGSEV